MENELLAIRKDAEPALPRVQDLPFDELMASADWALAEAVERVVRSQEKPGDNYAAHGTAP